MRLNYYFVIAWKEMRKEKKKQILDVILLSIAIMMILTCIMLYHSIKTYQAKIETRPRS